MKQDNAAKELSNSRIDDEDDDAEASPIDDEFFSEATVVFVKELASRTNDKEWHIQNHDRYQAVLRKPSSVLLEQLRADPIASLAPDVANTRYNISSLKKNDYGQGGYNDHFWAAFFDPSSGSKTKSCQLFFILRSQERLFRYGFAFGNYCSDYIQKLHHA